MKIEEIFEEILTEQLENKKLFNFLAEKWRIEKQDLSDTQIEKIYNRFQEIKNKLNPNLPQVSSFLSRFDGNFGYATFNPDNLKDITKYSYKQIKSLIDEYTPLGDLEEIEDTSIFDDGDTRDSPEKIQASKDLWFGNRYCILNLDGFRVYQIPDESTSNKFGYYYQELYRTFRPGVGGRPDNSYWCVTRRKASGMTNLWGNYRGDNNKRTFYFVIDESKANDPDTGVRKFYLAALQRSLMNSTGFIMNSILNDGDTSYTWDQISQIYPKLRDFKDLIVPLPYSPKEAKERSIVNQITELPGQYQFKRIERNLKKAFINAGSVLTKPESWQAMDGELKALYVNTTTEHSYLTKFANYPFLLEIRKSGADWSLLNNRLRTVGVEKGAGAIFAHLIKNDFQPGRTSKNNPSIVLYISKTDGKFGIFHLGHGDWLRMGAITYEPVYEKIKGYGLLDENKNPYLVEIFGVGKVEDDKSFYSVWPVGGVSSKSYLLSHDGFTKLTEKMTEVQNKGKSAQQIQDFQPDTDVDIKEIKGVS